MYGTIILHIAYVGVKLGLSLRVEHRLRVFQNRVLRGIFGSERQAVAGDFRKLYHEELNVCTAYQILLG
jgi:hypothetical protein